jgi:hypothetical protein
MEEVPVQMQVVLKQANTSNTPKVGNKIIKKKKVNNGHKCLNVNCRKS